MLAVQADIFDPPKPRAQAVTPWKPEPLNHAQWPPNYAGVFAWRIQTLTRLRADPKLAEAAREYYSTRPGEFICHWCDTYNPRKQRDKWMPFVLFTRQDEFVEYLEELRRDGQNGLVEKCRDIGATWLAVAYSAWCMLFIPGDATGWGSRKEDLVDKLGEPDSIFEKLRLLLDRIPDVFKPKRMKSGFLKLINEENGASISGEAGDNIGRGGRKSRYFKDESAHYERPEKIEAALGDNTDVQIDISSVNGLGNVFHRRREAGQLWVPGQPIDPGIVRVFIFDWRDHPEKTQEWYDQRKARAEREGMQHIFAQEVDRNYSAAVENTVIAYEWIDAAVDAHFHIPCLRIAPPDDWMAGLDLADEGIDKNALAIRQWIILRDVEDWGERDPGVSVRRVILKVREKHRRMKVQYDSIGIGAAVKAEYNRLIDDGELEYGTYEFIPWNASAAVQWPFDSVVPDDRESPLNREFFANMKAQAWWSLRSRFYKTWRARKFGDVYPADQLISLDGNMSQLQQLKKELAQPTRGVTSAGKMVINKKPEGTRSPNLADACVEAYFPAQEQGGNATIGSMSG